MAQELYTVNQVVDIFKISRKTLYNWKKKSVLKPIEGLEKGMSVRYRKEDVDKIINQNKENINVAS